MSAVGHDEPDESVRWNALVLAVIGPGLGHLYLGRYRQAWALFIVLLVLLLVAGNTGLLAHTAFGIWWLLAVLIGVRLYGVVSAYRIGSRPIVLPARRRLYVMVALVIAVPSQTIVFQYREALFGYSFYSIPSGSMQPTLIPGDYIVVDSRVRDYQVGDVVIYDNNGSRAVKRIAAMGGDSFALRNGEVILNGKSLGTFHAADYSRDPRRLDTQTIVLQPDQVFLLGDFRENSNDSRYIGPVSIDQLHGKVTYIWMADKRKRYGMKVE